MAWAARLASTKLRLVNFLTLSHHWILGLPFPRLPLTMPLIRWHNGKLCLIICLMNESVLVFLSERCRTITSSFLLFLRHFLFLHVMSIRVHILRFQCTAMIYCWWSRYLQPYSSVKTVNLVIIRWLRELRVRKSRSYFAQLTISILQPISSLHLPFHVNYTTRYTTLLTSSTFSSATGMSY